MNRISVGLKYYHLHLQNVISKDEFIKFCENIYKNILDDYCHFINVHNYHLNEIKKELKIECNINKCKGIGRHYRYSQRDTHSDPKYSYYIDCFDRIHHQIFHLYQLGLRVNIESKHDDDDDEINDEMIDLKFKKMKQTIITKRKKFGLDKFDRFKTEKNNKFNIITGSENISGITD